MLVAFIENSYKIKVKKIVAKFIIDDHFNIILTGLRELFIDIPNHAPYDIESMK